jgi:hypothetical protein
MKKMFLATLLVLGALSMQAGNWSWGLGFAFSGGGCSSPQYAASYSYYPGADYGYTGPNYAVGGMLLGALTGGIIGNSIHHQGWEGAAIGAASGLVVGSAAQNYAYARAAKASYQNYPPQPYQAYPAPAYPAPNYTAPKTAGPTTTFSQAAYSKPAYVIPDAPMVPDAPLLQNNTPYKRVSAKSSAKNLSRR